MPLDITRELPERIRSQREGIGYTPAALAERSELSPEALADFESGRRTPQFHELHRLAWALGLNPMALLDEMAPSQNPRLTPARFRTQADASLAPDDRRLLALAAEVGRVARALWTQVRSHPPRVRVGCTGIQEGKPAWSQGYTLGELARQQLIPGRAPILGLKDAVEDLGVHVAWVRFQDPKVEGACVAEKDALPVILLNIGAPRVKRPHTCRAILAHELCHVLHDGNRRSNPITSVSYAHQDEGLLSDQERRANGFAPAFLAPEAFLNLNLAPYELAKNLVHAWYFSLDGAAWHVKNLLRLSAVEKDALLSRLRAGVRTRALDFERPAPEQPWLAGGLVERMAQKACEDGQISEGRLREILEMA